MSPVVLKTAEAREQLQQARDALIAVSNDYIGGGDRFDELLTLAIENTVGALNRMPATPAENAVRA